jgi:ABC-type proline/glycine betaine transport system permease subunit
MELINQVFQYVVENRDRFLDAVMVHIKLSAFALLFSMLLCVPLGILCAKNSKVQTSAMNVVNSLRVIPEFGDSRNRYSIFRNRIYSGVGGANRIGVSSCFN